MCNPKPGTRCVTDSAKPYEKSLAEFKDLSAKLLDADGDEITKNYTPEEYDTAYAKLADLAEELNTKKIFFATAFAKSEGALDNDPKKAAIAQRKCIDYLNSKEADLSAEADKLLNNNYKLGNRHIVETAIFLNKFQEFADEDRKIAGKWGTQLRTARFMSEYGVDIIEDRLIAKLDFDRDEKLASNAKGMNPETIKNSHKQDVEAIARAAQLARNDANAVLDRDIKKNSSDQDWQERNMRREIITKKRDGSFDFTVIQKVQAPNIETALRRNQDSFDLKKNLSKHDLNVTLEQSPTEPNTYEITTKYNRDVGETIRDAMVYQDGVWLGTPEFRKKKRN